MSGAADLHAVTTSLRAAGRKALVPYLTAGFPSLAEGPALLEAVAAAGCRVVEIGVPFSDPVADGPVIQAAAARALAQGTTLADCLELAARAAALELVPVLMTYVNPVLAMGWERFAAAAADAGAGGVILPDVPLEESAPAREALRAAGLALVDLVAPTSGPARTERIARTARGFLYVVSHTGVTGGDAALDAALAPLMARVRAVTDTPCYVGFGIGTPERARAAAALADGVVVGSALLRVVENAEPAARPEAARTFLASLAAAAEAAGGAANGEETPS